MADLTILEAMDDQALFGPWFSAPSWRAWKACIAALFALPMSEAEVEIYARHTGRVMPPSEPAREAWLVIGRRGGKSLVAAFVAVYLATFRDYRSILARGERGTVMVIAADRRQARTVMRYVLGFLDSVAMLRSLVVRRTQEAIDLSNSITVEIHTASFRTVRGYTLVGAICNEVAVWPQEHSASPDAEILAALRPAMLTVPGALLLCISSPYARRGVVWDAYRAYWAQAGGPLIWQGSTVAMNPCVDASVVAEAFESDPVSARAEYGAEFRTDVETYVSIEAVEAAVVAGQRELAPRPGFDYVAFVDPSGGSQDSMTLAVAHAEEEDNGRIVLVLDTVVEVEPPFSPEHVVAEFAEVLRAYRCSRVTGDRYGGEWPREAFRKVGISYDLAGQAKSDLYRSFLPLLNSGNVELLDQARLHAQLLGLERRTARGGRDSIDHAPNANAHDDAINAAVGALLEASARARRGLAPLTW